MSASTTKALSLAIVAALWAVISHFGKVPLQLWPVLVGLACFVGAGSGVMGLQKSVLGSASGVVWALLYATVSTALGRNDLLDALLLERAREQGRVTFRDIEELDTEETADLLGLTPNAVKIRLHRARQALRTLLEPELMGETSRATATSNPA